MKKNKKKHRVRNFFINLGIVLLLLVGLALVFNNQIKNFFIDRMSSQVEISTLTKKDVEKNLQADAGFDFDAVEAVSTEAVMKAQLASAPKNAIGGIAVPSVKLNLAIFKGVSGYTLLYGAATLREDQKMGVGNYALASHNMIDESLLFAPLHHVKNGATIYLTDLTNIYSYKIDSIDMVAPTHTELIQDVPGKTIVTLVTCDAEGKNRLIVQGSLTATTAYKDATDDMLNAFGISRNIPGW